MMGMLSRAALEEMGFASLGDNVFISEKASIYNPSNISIGSNVRVDDFCIISAGGAGIEIGNYVHIAAYSSLIGAARIVLSDFSGLSARVSIYSSSDDYSGAALTNPMIPEKYTRVVHEGVYVGKHVIIGCGSVILPGTRLENGVAVGALSLVQKNCKEFGIYAGAPARFIKQRKRDLLELELELQLQATGSVDRKDVS